LRWGRFEVGLFLTLGLHLSPNICPAYAGYNSSPTNSGYDTFPANIRDSS
jgi:hypothetical protein